MKQPYIHFSEEEKQQANATDLVAFLQARGEPLKRMGSEYLCKNYNRLFVRDNKWYDNYMHEGGNAISFMQKVYGMSFQDSVSELLGKNYNVLTFQSQSVDEKPKEKKEFIPPQKNENNKKALYYLTAKRHINKDIVNYFIEQGKIFEDKKYHNVVFCGFNEKNEMKFAYKRGTYNNFKGDAAGSDVKYSFNHIGTSGRLYVFEASIDLLSYITLYKENWKKHSYIALDGLSESPLFYFLANNDVSNIILCLDHDDKGLEANQKFEDMLIEKGYRSVEILLSKYKDWNETLKATKGYEALPPSKNFSMERYNNIVLKLMNENTDTSKNEIQNLCKDLIEIINIGVENNEKIFYNKSLTLTKNITSLYEKNKNFHLTKNDWLNSMKTQYKAYLDNASFKSKSRELIITLRDCSIKQNQPTTHNDFNFYYNLADLLIRSSIRLIKEYMLKQNKVKEQNNNATIQNI